MSVPGTETAEFRLPARVSGPSNFSYRSTVHDGRVYHETYHETPADGAGVESHEVAYAIGSGEHGRSYVIARGDALFLSPLSYYSARAGWDLSPGYAAGTFRDFTRPVTPGCLFCHAGLPQPLPDTTNRYRQPVFRALAIGCERCHGPGELHVKKPAASTIVNPAKLRGELRDDVCYQCHLGGDIRILRPGKTEMDYRPGTALSQVIAVFSLPAAAKPEGLDAVGQAGQLRMSRCWKESRKESPKESQDGLGCITCHDPHGQEAAPGAAFYRSRCQQCHATRPCIEDAARRRATSPADDCVACHMPRAPLNRIAHIAHTNHRIVRYKEDVLDPSLVDSQVSDLIYESSGQPDSRSRALAYAVAAKGLPVFSERALRLLQAAARTNPQDAEVACALGLVEPDLTGAQLLLEHAVAGSGCVEGKIKLSNLLAERGERERALRLGRQALDSEPWDAAVVLSLAGIYLRSGDLENARTLLNRVRDFDPANPALEELLRRSRGAR